MKDANWGFDTGELDPTIRPQDDFFKYVNGKWIKKHAIPPEESRWGSFIILRHQTEKQLKKIVETTREQKISGLYRSGMDMPRRNALGAKPLQPLLDTVYAIRDTRGLVDALSYFETIDAGGPFSLVVDQDMKDSTHYILYIEQSGLGMPDREYYLKNGPEQIRVRTAYQKHIVSMFKLIGEKHPKEKMETVMRVETALARASMDKVSLRDPDKVYHKKSIAQLEKLAPIGWQRYFKLVGAKNVTKLIVSQPKFIAAVGTMLHTVSLEDWKTYLTFHIANGSASLLSQSFIDQSFSFYGETLSGQKELKPLWRRVLSLVNGSLGEMVGKLYVAEHFPATAKRRMDALIDDLFVAYEHRIKNLDWMSPATKKKAVTKLRTMGRKVGYPTKWKDYTKLVIKKGDYFGNALRADLFEHQRAMRKIGKPFQRHEWFTTPQVVNAYYAPTMNEIVFPAAILQPPFFHLAADAGVNYGAIGTVIGHEMTHGFDDSGAKFDAKGNLKSWWTPADKKRFEQKSKLVVTQFDAYQVEGINVNGKLTLGENIADLGGASIAYDAYMRHLLKHPEEDCTMGGYTPAQRFFLGHGITWREHARPEYQKMLISVDAHAPDKFRVNGSLSNLAEFYAAYDVKKGDKLYRAPNDRAKIW